MERIARGDVDAQARTLTPIMRHILEVVEEGTHDYGRAIGQEVGVPYPQTYRTLQVLCARGFITIPREDAGATGRTKRYVLTEEGAALLTKVRSQGLPDRQTTPTRRVDPEDYAMRMRLGPVFRWLRRHGVVDSVKELEHLMSCSECNLLLEQHGFTGDVRCELAAQKVNDKEWI